MVANASACSITQDFEPPSPLTAGPENREVSRGVGCKIRLSKNLDIKIREIKDLDFGDLVSWTVGLCNHRGVGCGRQGWMSQVGGCGKS